MESCVHLALGTAGGGVHVWRFSSSEGLTSVYSDEEAFSSCVRSVRFASRGQLLTGGDDGCLQLALVRKRKRGGTLELHSDHVTSLEAVEDGSLRVHFLSGSADHSLALWGREGGRWECLRHFRGHKAAVIACAAHPSGRLALSVGADHTLRTWNLVRGRQAFVTRLNARECPTEVLWSPDGRYYLLVMPNRVDCFAVTAASAVAASVALTTSAVAFVSPQLCVMASQDRLNFVDIVRGEVLATIGVDEAEGLAKTDGRRVRWLRWDAEERLLFVACRYPAGSSLHILQLPDNIAAAVKEDSAVKIVALCRTELTEFRISAFDARRFRVERKTQREGTSKPKAKKRKVVS